MRGMWKSKKGKIVLIGVAVGLVVVLLAVWLGGRSGSSQGTTYSSYTVRRPGRLYCNGRRFRRRWRHGAKRRSACRDDAADQRP